MCAPRPCPHHLCCPWCTLPTVASRVGGQARSTAAGSCAPPHSPPKPAQCDVALIGGAARAAAGRALEALLTAFEHEGLPPAELAAAADAVAAYALGATWNERHFTKDRTWKGTDHAASLAPAGLGKLCRDLDATYEAFTMKATEVLDIESEQRDKLKYRKGSKVNAVDE